MNTKACCTRQTWGGGGWARGNDGHGEGRVGCLGHRGARRARGTRYHVPTHTLLLITRPSCSFGIYFCTSSCTPLRSRSSLSFLFYLFNFLTTDDSGVVTGSPFPSFANFCFFFFLFSWKKHAIATIAFLCYLQRLQVAHHPGARESRARKAGQKVRTDVQDASFQR